jgi:hypothetical protein
VLTISASHNYTMYMFGNIFSTYVNVFKHVKD